MTSKRQLLKLRAEVVSWQKSVQLAIAEINQALGVTVATLDSKPPLAIYDPAALRRANIALCEAVRRSDQVVADLTPEGDA